jgi:hypothetical protein
VCAINAPIMSKQSHRRSLVKVPYPSSRPISYITGRVARPCGIVSVMHQQSIVRDLPLTKTLAQAICDNLSITLGLGVLTDNTMTKCYSEERSGTSKILPSREANSGDLGNSNGDIWARLGENLLSPLRRAVGAIPVFCTVVHRRLTN